MTRRGYKTVNLPAALVERIDRIVQDGSIASATSRDDFVRQAVNLLMLAIDAGPHAPRPLELVQAYADRNFRPTTEAGHGP
ncbi:MAG: ribbon-helix-helix domain-containing protein [Candidatus Thermoplasmatota archaeon]